MDLPGLLADLRDESAGLDALVADLPPADWARPTPAAGWTVAHQIAHLAWTDGACIQAITDPAGFAEHLAAAAAAPESFVDEGAGSLLREAAGSPLSRWRAGRRALAEALSTVPTGTRLPWFGTTMSAPSMVTARIMETWAHGLDVADALGVVSRPTHRLRHIAHLGHRTLGHGFAVHARPVPDQPVRLELSAPDGGVWTFGPAEANEVVRGPALDFCLLVVQRRHPDDLALRADGPVAREWLQVAQAFAGPPGAGRRPTATRPPGAASTP